MHRVPSLSRPLFPCCDGCISKRTNALALLPCHWYCWLKMLPDLSSCGMTIITGKPLLRISKLHTHSWSQAWNFWTNKSHPYSCRSNTTWGQMNKNPRNRSWDISNKFLGTLQKVPGNKNLFTCAPNSRKEQFPETCHGTHKTRSLRNDNKNSQSNSNFQHFMVVPFPTQKKRIWTIFLSASKAHRPQKRKFHFYVVSPSLKNESFHNVPRNIPRNWNHKFLGLVWLALWRLDNKHWIWHVPTVAARGLVSNHADREFGAAAGASRYDVLWLDDTCIASKPRTLNKIGERERAKPLPLRPYIIKRAKAIPVDPYHHYPLPVRSQAL